MTNCQNCGAPLDPEHVQCPYCGTVNLDFVQVDGQKPFYVRFRTRGTTFVMRVIVTGLSFNLMPNTLDVSTLWDTRQYCSDPPELCVTLAAISPVKAYERSTDET